MDFAGVLVRKKDAKIIRNEPAVYNPAFLLTVFAPNCLPQGF